VADPGTLRCPACLKGDARRVWRRVLPLLKRMGVLGQIDAEMLTRYCDLSARYRAAADWLIRHGEIYPIKDRVGKSAGFRQWPQVAIAGKLATALLRMEQELGMTPASRPNLKVAPHEPQEKNKSRFFTHAG